MSSLTSQQDHVDQPIQPLSFTFPLSANSYPIDLPIMTGNQDSSQEQENAEASSSTDSNGGITPSGSAEDGLAKQGIPSTSVYPRNLAQKQMRRFARSADKRQSVHMLGNIEHLQHHFMKFGLAAAEAPDLRGPIRPALGGVLPISAASPTSPPRSQPAFPLLPPSPLKPATVPMPPYPLARNDAPKVDLPELKAKASKSLMEVEKIWQLGITTDEDDIGAETTVPVLELLKATLHAINIVRTFALAIPSSSLPGAQASHKLGGLGLPPYARRASGGPGNRQSISTPSRPAGRAVSVGAHPVANNAGSQSASAPSTSGTSVDPLAGLRKAALDVLTSLKAMEERCRIEGSNVASDELSGSPLVVSRAISPALDSVEATTDDPLEGLIPSGTTSTLGLGPPPRPLTALRSVSGSSISGRGSASPPLLADDDRDEAYFFAEREGLGLEESQRKTWYERLAAGEDGWLYRGDVRVLPDLEVERRVVAEYLDAVERVLFTGKDATGVDQHRKRAWASALGMKPKRNSEDGQADKSGVSAAGTVWQLTELDEEDEEAEEPDVPKWARDIWPGQSLERAHEFAFTHLPYNLMILLPNPNQPDFHEAFLDRLSDGFILITAYNTAIQRSAASWGFVVQEDIHDTIEDAPGNGDGPEGTVKARDWTFRRAGNLRAWGAALRHRYRIPLVFPNQITTLKHAVPLEVTHAPQRKVSASLPSAMKADDSIPYDPLAIARKNEGWEKALTVVLERWLEALAKEVRYKAVAKQK